MKTERLLAMTVLLLNRGRMSAKELAERFEVSVKTIYRDMETLSRAGIPVVALQGASGGFEIMDRYTLDRYMITPEEIGSLLSAVRGASQAIQDRTYDDLVQKFISLLQPEGRLPVTKGETVIFDFHPWGQGSTAKQKLVLLRQAISERRIASFIYIRQDGSDSRRTVEPTVLVMKGGVWYLQAYCRERNDFRIFRLSRIHEVNLLPETFELREAPRLESYEWDKSWSGREETPVRLVFRAEARYRFGDTFFPEQITARPDGGFTVEGNFAVDEWFCGMLLSYGDLVKVEHPSSLAEEIKSRAERIVRVYDR
ncbi:MULTISPECIES: YafY family protein [Paenibacillus]|uniref:helix-turn-helix transcriptional regulator n=1 Tax=Paenibacillus TaxID=44249 RepID=UPI002FE213B5